MSGVGGVDWASQTPTPDTFPAWLIICVAYKCLANSEIATPATSKTRVLLSPGHKGSATRAPPQFFRNAPAHPLCDGFRRNEANGDCPGFRGDGVCEPLLQQKPLGLLQVQCLELRSAMSEANREFKEKKPGASSADQAFGSGGVIITWTYSLPFEPSFLGMPWCRAISIAP